MSGVAVMEELKRKLGAVAAHLPRERPLVYLDYPVHLNFGDILIMRGTERFFADYGYRVIDRAGYMNFTKASREAVPEDAVIVLHGGGNFGDLYPVHQRFRERVVREFPDHPIVIMPQTAFFQSSAARKESAALFRQHRNLLLMVRDRPSLEVVSDHFTPQVLLMPDMAHQLWNTTRLPVALPTGGRMELWREDIEASGQPPAQHSLGGESHDWMDFVPVWQRRVFGMILRLHRLEGVANTRLGAQHAWQRYCEHLAGRMREIFTPYAEIRTNRLHGMIFAALLRKKVSFNENSYGKLGHYARQWFDGHPDISAH